MHVFEHGILEALDRLMHDKISEEGLLLLSHRYDLGMLILEVLIIVLVPYGLSLEDIQVLQAGFPGVGETVVLLAEQQQFVNKRMR